jgi:uncharacterized protein
VFTAAHAGDFEDGLAAVNRKDYTTALEKFRVEAQQGNSRAKTMLGVMYYNGQGVDKDYKEALVWFMRAAAQGNAMAQSNLGLMHSKGQGGLVQDYKEAVRWYRLAAQQGSSIAQHNLGTNYREGKGVAQDYKEAVRWYRLAAEQGVAESQYFLGFMHYEGQGVAKDYLRAHMWWNISASRGAEKSVKARDLVASKMTREQIAKAQEMAKTCLAKKYKDCDVSPYGDRDETCDEIVGLMGRAKVLSVICPQSHDGYVKEFFLYGIQLPERCGSASDTQYQSLIKEAGGKLRTEAAEMGTDGFCERNRPYGG